MRPLLTGALTVACAVALCTPVRAQSAPALRGTVRDSTGKPLARVEVSYKRVETTTDSAGQFRLSPVPLGLIKVRFMRDGNLLGELQANVTSDTMPAVLIDALGDRSEPRVLRGSVVDSLGGVVRDATIDVLTALREVRTDSAGLFVVRDLPARRHLLRVRRVGYSPTFLSVDLNDTISTRVRIVVRQYAGQNLGLVVVRANRGPAHLEGFLNRAARPSGWGRIFTAEQIAQRSPLRTSDMLLGLAGVQIRQNGWGAGTALGRGGCRLAVFINGFPAPQQRDFGIDQMVNAQDLAGVEVYNGPGGVPPELIVGPTNGCGTVALWTK
jgi:Carboxypeptidase regulatory-like domain/TonB-dependent Receptor Plug Domain